jgi:hypothetical protein
MIEARNDCVSLATPPVASPIYRPLLVSLACVGVFCTWSVVAQLLLIILNADGYVRDVDSFRSSTNFALKLCAFAGVGFAGMGMVRSLTGAVKAPKAFIVGLALWAAHGVLLVNVVYSSLH